MSARRDDERDRETERERDAEMTEGVRARRDHHRAGPDRDERERAEQLGDTATSE